MLSVADLVPLLVPVRWTDLWRSQPSSGAQIFESPDFDRTRHSGSEAFSLEINET